MSTIIVRRATKKDAEIVADFSRKSFYDTYAALNTKEDMDDYMSEHLSKELMMDQVCSLKNIFYLAFVNNELAGYIQLNDENLPASLKEMNCLEIVRFYAAKEMIGKGIGSSLMKASIDHARSINKNLLWLMVWQKNTRAIEFYKKWGFEIFDTNVFKLGKDLQDDWVMKKSL